MWWLKNLISSVLNSYTAERAWIRMFVPDPKNGMGVFEPCWLIYCSMDMEFQQKFESRQQLIQTLR